ncbi:hypothetical protein A0J61_00512 [Choanephora cucurbitarum]|uniref:Uncharacterized protein n=1 Tax=Choanephora cucurbitarum TaxID=101091 RepID=A0A1C7NQT2_9FUNG|nr:hypothetical protein A0J61_00512 [Choanephora cucurbitarum]
MSSSSCLIDSSRKRKRSSGLHVHFSTQPQSIIYTYSQSDYDRSGLVPEKNGHQTNRIFLAFSINIVSNPIHPTDVNYVTKKQKKHAKRPKLTIDTTNLQGPLYFTKLTTNHQKIKKEQPDDEEMDPLTKENTRRNSLPLEVLC